jgi:hypothetical protein
MTSRITLLHEQLVMFQARNPDFDVTEPDDSLSGKWTACYPESDGRTTGRIEVDSLVVFLALLFIARPVCPIPGSRG